MRVSKEEKKDLDKLSTVKNKKEYPKRRRVCDQEQDQRKNLLYGEIVDPSTHIQHHREKKLQMVENYSEAEQSMQHGSHTRR